MGTPRDYRETAVVLQQDIATMLFGDPEAFDCLVFRAEDAAHDETVSIVPDTVGSIESGERAQEYMPPEKARARIVPEDGFGFASMAGLTENFLGASQPMHIVLSVSGVRKYSLIQWLECPDVDSEESVTRTVYVLDSNPIGRTLGVGLVHTCLPLPALGELPEVATASPGDDDGSDSDDDSAGEMVPDEVAGQNVTGGY